MARTLLSLTVVLVSIAATTSENAAVDQIVPEVAAFQDPELSAILTETDDAGSGYGDEGYDDNESQETREREESGSGGPHYPTRNPTYVPSRSPSFNPTLSPTTHPSRQPTLIPTSHPTLDPTYVPSASPSAGPTYSPSKGPAQPPTFEPSAG